MSVLIRSIEKLVGVIGVFAAMLLVPLVVATCWEVWARYVLGAPTIWAYEIGYILTGAHFLLGLAYTLRAGEHIRIDLFSAIMPARLRATIDAAAYAIILALLVWLSWALLDYLVEGFTSGERSGQSALNMVVWPFRVVFLVSFSVLALQVLAELLKAVLYLRSQREA